jgi:hypothetical protein
VVSNHAVASESRGRPLRDHSHAVRSVSS